MTRNPSFLLLLAASLLGGMSVVVAQEEGDIICVEGFIMDYFCIERGTLLDNPSVVTLEGPEQHSVHCLVDVSVCYQTPFHVLEDLGDSYGPGWELDDNTQLMDLARTVGRCSTCTGDGDLRNGFAAVVRGEVIDADQKLLSVLEVGLPGEELCGGEAPGCPLDVQQCGDQTLDRDPENDCQFPPCVCPLDIQDCPDGSTVVRIPPLCEFEDCPTSQPTSVPTSEPTIGTPMPSVAPVEGTAGPTQTPTAAPTASPSMSPTLGEPAVISCAEYQTAMDVPGLEGVTLEYIVNMNPIIMANATSETLPTAMGRTMHNASLINGTMIGPPIMSVRVTYEGEGWLGFAVSQAGAMIGSSAVIGVPNATTGGGNAAHYNLTFENGQGYDMFPNQTLMDASITQDENGTILEFTRYLEEDVYGLPINGSGFNYFLVAHGMDNTLAYHGPTGRSSFNLTLTPCNTMDMVNGTGMALTVPVNPTSPSTVDEEGETVTRDADETVARDAAGSDPEGEPLQATSGTSAITAIVGAVAALGVAFLNFT